MSGSRRVKVQVAYGARHQHQILLQGVHGTYSLVAGSSTERRVGTREGGPIQWLLVRYLVVTVGTYVVRTTPTYSW
jgi:hypothetical protein